MAETATQLSIGSTFGLSTPTVLQFRRALPKQSQQKPSHDDTCSCRTTGFRCNLALVSRSPSCQRVCHPLCTGWHVHRLLSSESSRESIARVCGSVQRQDCRLGSFCIDCLCIVVRACREPVPWLSRSIKLRATTKRDKAKRFAAQLVRESPLQGEGRGFESLNAHQGSIRACCSVA